MPRAPWYDPLLAFLGEQRPETTRLTLTLAELGTLVGGGMPAGGFARGYWRGRGGKAMSHRLAAIGWRVEYVGGRPATITFERLPADTIE